MDLVIIEDDFYSEFCYYYRPTPSLQGLSGVLLRLGDAERGFPEDAGFRDAQVFNAFLSGLRAALGDKAQAPAAFAGELSLVPQAERDRLRAAVPGLADTLDASFPIRPPFPPAAGGRLDVTPARHRVFLLSMLPIYHAHARPGSIAHGAGYRGRGHISRAFIFASAMAGIMEGMGHTVDRTALLCGIAGHDAGRVNNGADTPEQEAESARHEVQALCALGGSCAGGGRDGQGRCQNQ